MNNPWLNVDIPLTFKLAPIPTSPATVSPAPTVNPAPTVSAFDTVTSSGSPMTTLLVPVAVSISFEVPSISKTSVAKLILSFDPESADTAKFDPPGALLSTYDLIDCWVASAAALLDAILSSSV